ncbi:MAG TPA: NAD(P)/FAD-dependent oxidoreductase [Blastococcus sp.]
MSPHHIQVDVAVVGAGPAGLYAAYCAGFRGLSVSVLDSLPEPGGQISALYPEKPIYDVAGLPAVRGRDLVRGLVEQAAPFSPTYVLGDQVVALDRRPHPEHGETGIVLTTAAGRTVSCGAVVLTAGIGTFRPRPLPPGEAHVGRGLMYFVPTLAELAGRDVMIVGGGDSAFDWALALEPLARSVTLVHRRDNFRAHQHTVDQVLSSSVRVLTRRQVHAVHGVDQVEAVDVRHDQDGTIETHAVQALVAALGFTADLGPLATWGLTLENRNIVVDTAMWTGLPGIYAAGDVTAYPGKVRLISVGFGEAATAVNNAATYLDPGADLFPGHSTDAAVPAQASPAPA